MRTVYTYFADKLYAPHALPRNCQIIPGEAKLRQMEKCTLKLTQESTLNFLVSASNTCTDLFVNKEDISAEIYLMISGIMRGSNKAPQN